MILVKLEQHSNTKSPILVTLPGYEAVTGRAGYADWYKKDIKLQILGPVGDVVSEWVYVGAFIKSMTPDGLDWSNNGDAANITLNISYDYAVLSY